MSAGRIVPGKQEQMSLACFYIWGCKNVLVFPATQQARPPRKGIHRVGTLLA